MVETQVPIRRPQERANQEDESLHEREYAAALAVSPLFARIDQSILWTVAKIFASSRDKRVKRGGYLFLAHLLRYSNVDQLSLYPGTEIGDVAKITIPNVLKLCLHKKHNGWLWCYETTLKYLNLLVVAGVLTARPHEQGIYYISLGSYALLPEHAAQQIEQLARKRPKLSRSTAFQRTAIHCTIQDMTAVSSAAPYLVDSASYAGNGIDEQDVKRAVHAICLAIERVQHIILEPTAMLEITRVFAEQTVRVFNGKFVARTKGDLHRILPARFTLSKGNRDGNSNSQEEEAHENLPTGDGSACVQYRESTSKTENLPTVVDMVDSSRVVLSDSVFITITDSSENILSDATSADESTIALTRHEVVDSVPVEEQQKTLVSPHPQANRFSVSTFLYWRFPDEDQDYDEGLTEQTHLATLLSYRFNADEGKVGHYRTLLGQDVRILDLAIVDSLLRSYFPDPKHKPQQLGGGWVTRQYQVYRGGKSVPEHILAWANTTYTYDALESTFQAIAQWQDAHGQVRRTCPWPDEVIVDSTRLEHFWASGAAPGLSDLGYLYVDVEGDLLSCEEYEQCRLRSLKWLLATEPDVLAPMAEYEVATYLDWTQPWLCDPEEEAYLLANLPEKLLRYIDRLERVLDGEQYKVNVRVRPLDRRRIIEVCLRKDPLKAWLLPYPEDIIDFLKWYRETAQREETERIGEQGGSLSESSEPGDEVEPGEVVMTPPDTYAEMRSQSDEAPAPLSATPADLSIVPYTLTFDETGATIVHMQSGTCYRITATTATTTIDLLRYHSALVRSLLEDTPEKLQLYAQLT